MTDHPPGPAGAARGFGRDGVSGVADHDRAMRARDVSRPSPADEAAARARLDELLARTRPRR